MPTADAPFLLTGLERFETVDLRVALGPTAEPRFRGCGSHSRSCCHV